MIAGIASILGLILGGFIGGLGVASTYGEPLTFVQGVVITVIGIIWLVLTVFAIATEEHM